MIRGLPSEPAVRQTITNNALLLGEWISVLNLIFSDRRIYIQDQHNPATHAAGLLLRQVKSLNFGVLSQNCEKLRYVCPSAWNNSAANL